MPYVRYFSCPDDSRLITKESEGVVLVVILGRWTIVSVTRDFVYGNKTEGAFGNLISFLVHKILFWRVYVIYILERTILIGIRDANLIEQFMLVMEIEWFMGCWLFENDVYSSRDMYLHTQQFLYDKKRKVPFN